jgi:hypothetical protein
VQLIEQARSIALYTPPLIDMWAPNKIFDWRFSIWPAKTAPDVLLISFNRK